MKIYCTYPLPTPATYPSGAGTPKKCFLFLLAKAAADIFAILMIGYENPILFMHKTSQIQSERIQQKVIYEERF